MSNISKVVSNKIQNSAYEKMKELKEFKGFTHSFVEIVYFDKKNIDKGQYGYRYNDLNDEIIDDWPDDNYVVFGIDDSIGDAGKPLIIKIDEEKLPIYHFENFDYNYPEIITDCLEDYISISNMIFKYYENTDGNHITENDYNQLLEKINKISDSSNWTTLLEILNS